MKNPGQPEIRVRSRVERLESNLNRMHAIPVPETLLHDLGVAAHRRVIVRVGDLEWKRAIQAPKSGQPYLIIGLQYLLEAGLREGSTVEVFVRADPNPDVVDVAEELLEALAQDGEARKRWKALTPGLQRSANLYVNSAKRMTTRIRRAVELTEKIRTGTLHGS